MNQDLFMEGFMTFSRKITEEFNGQKNEDDQSFTCDYMGAMQVCYPKKKEEGELKDMNF